MAASLALHSQHTQLVGHPVHHARLATQKAFAIGAISADDASAAIKVHQAAGTAKHSRVGFDNASDDTSLVDLGDGVRVWAAARFAETQDYLSKELASIREKIADDSKRSLLALREIVQEVSGSFCDKLEAFPKFICDQIQESQQALKNSVDERLHPIMSRLTTISRLVDVTGDAVSGVLGRVEALEKSIQEQQSRTACSVPPLGACSDDFLDADGIFTKVGDKVNFLLKDMELGGEVRAIEAESGRALVALDMGGSRHVPFSDLYRPEVIYG